LPPQAVARQPAFAQEPVVKRAVPLGVACCLLARALPDARWAPDGCLQQHDSERQRVWRPLLLEQEQRTFAVQLHLSPALPLRHAPVPHD
jgi:hypothetical protein